MERSALMTASDLGAFVGASAHKQVKVGVCDLDGVLRGKYMTKEKFLHSLQCGFGFSDVLFAWDVNDQLYDDTGWSGWRTGYGDAKVRLLPETARRLPFEGDMPFVLGEVTGQLERICPRALMKRVLRRAEATGLRARAACEFEFLVVEESAQTLAEKNYRNLRPLGTGNFGYSVIRNSVNSDFYRGLLELCETMGMPLEGLHEESGPGALEAALAVDDALAAADKATLFKTFSKVFAQKRGLMATFMAKWSSSMPGQGGHVHMSLVDEGGRSVFFDQNREHDMSQTMHHFIGGLQKLAPSITAMLAPTINSYRRLVPGFWAPTAADWGLDNRTVAIRVISGSPEAQRIEFRVPGADANPYLTLAATLGAGLWGIENRVEPSVPVSGCAYRGAGTIAEQLPRTLSEASDNLRRCTAAHEIFGTPFVEHYAASRDWEERQFRRHVSDWELARYMEII